MSDRDVDAEFADIVAHWDEVEAPPDNPAADGRPDHDPKNLLDNPRQTGVNPPLEPTTDPTNPPPVRPFVVWRGAEPAAPDRNAGDDGSDPLELDDLDDEEHFEPGPTAPLPPQEDLQFWGIIAGLVAGPLLLLWLVLFRPAVSGWWTLAAVGLTVMGFVLLVLRQPSSRDEDDPDNGARI
jgi:hypothetical protein